MRWDSPFVLATAGTFAIHVFVLVAGDAVVVLNPNHPAPPAPHIELVDVELPAVVAPPPPPVAHEVPPVPPVPPVPRDDKRVTPTPIPLPQAAEPENKPEPAPVVDPPTSGGEQVVTLDGVPPSATGVGVAVGRRTSPYVGRGGSGGGTGSGAGAGSGSGEVAPPPVSVAMIKKRAMPHGDYAYFDAGKDYPAEARQLEIEGAIRVRLIVSADGKVTSLVLLNKLGHGLDELALKRAQEIQFDPARDSDDHPVASVVVWTFNMTLPK